MVVKVYISGISGNKEVKKRQQRVLMILDSRNISYELVDIAEPEHEAEKDFMQNNSKSLGGTVSDPNPRHPLPPQIFNDTDYCGDYDQFDMSNEIDELEKFLKIAPSDSTVTSSSTEIHLGNGDDNVVSSAQDGLEENPKPDESASSNVDESNEAEAAGGDSNEAEAKVESSEAEAAETNDGNGTSVVENGETVDDGAADEEEES